MVEHGIFLSSSRGMEIEDNNIGLLFHPRYEFGQKGKRIAQMHLAESGLAEQRDYPDLTVAGLVYPPTASRIRRGIVGRPQYIRAFGDVRDHIFFIVDLFTAGDDIDAEFVQ